MKNLPLFSLLSLTLACGDGLVDHAKLAASSTAKIATGASLILDAAKITGNSSSPNGTCDETSWQDSTSNNNDGTIDCSGGGGRAGTGTPTDPDRLVFDGSSTFVSTNLDVDETAMTKTTWLLWVRPKVTTLSQLLSIDGGDDNRALVINSTFQAKTGGADFNSLLSAETSKWQFVRVTFTANKLTVSKNVGDEKSSTTAPTYPASNSETLTVGKEAGSAAGFFEGDIAWLAVYPRELTASEIEDTCEALKSRFSGASCD